MQCSWWDNNTIFSYPGRSGGRALNKLLTSRSILPTIIEKSSTRSTKSILLTSMIRSFPDHIDLSTVDSTYSGFLSTPGERHIHSSDRAFGSAQQVWGHPLLNKSADRRLNKTIHRIKDFHITLVVPVRDVMTTVKIGREDVGIFINRAILNDHFCTVPDLTNLIEALFKK